MLLLVFSVSCRNELPALRQPVAVGNKDSAAMVGPTDAKSVSEAVSERNGPMQVVISSLQIVQEAYLHTAEVNAGAEKVTVLVDEDYTLAIQSQGRRVNREIRVHLTDLESDIRLMDIIVDGPDGTQPGCRIPVRTDGSPVRTYENGRLTREDDRLELLFSDRPTVQRALSGMILAIRGARGEL
ncbi:MAG: hypothetical protein RLY31_554 [Bacteroidota bacterium]|jgi:hypothetical protein